MGLVLVTAPLTDPLTLDEVKLHLRVDIGDDDALIKDLIKVVRQAGEDLTRRAFVTQTWRWTLDGFPGSFEVPMPPLVAVDSITYIDTDGASQTLATSEYDVDTDSDPGRITPAYGVLWPTTRDVVNAVTVQFQAGYGALTAVPPSLRHAMKLHIGHLYEHREILNIGSAVNELPFGYDALIAPYRVHRFP